MTPEDADLPWLGFQGSLQLVKRANDKKKRVETSSEPESRCKGHGAVLSAGFFGTKGFVICAGAHPAFLIRRGTLR